MKRAKQIIYWTALSSNDRLHDIDLIKRAISDKGGSIVHFTMFSDIGLSLNIEIEEGDISHLYSELLEFLSISEPLPNQLDATSELEWLIRMHVSFAKGTGDKRVEIPKVPG